MSHRITQKQLLARAGWCQSILEEILHKGTMIELNYMDGAYTIFLKDGKGGMSELAHIQSTAACYQVFRCLYEVLYLVQDEQKRQQKKEVCLKN